MSKKNTELVQRRSENDEKIRNNRKTRRSIINLLKQTIERSEPRLLVFEKLTGEHLLYLGLYNLPEDTGYYLLKAEYTINSEELVCVCFVTEDYAKDRNYNKQEILKSLSGGVADHLFKQAYEDHKRRTER